MSVPTQRSGLLRLLPRYLFDTDQPRWLYLLKVLPLTLVPSLLLGGLLLATPGGAPTPELGLGPVAFFGVVLFAPLFETLLMTPPVLILNRFFGPSVAIAGSSLLWGIAHSLASPRWGLVIWWPFLIFSAVLLAWRGKGIWKAILTVAAAHALHNLLPGLMLLVG